MSDSAARRATTARIQSLPQQPPHSIEAEQSVLGGLMLNNKAFFDLADKLAASDFYRADHQLIYTGIAALIGDGKACDFVTLSERLRHEGRLDEAGGPEYLASLATDTYSIANLHSYADIVRERSVLRSLIAAGSDIGEMGFRPEGRTPQALIDEAEQKVFAIRERSARGATQYEQVGNVMRRVEARIEQLKNNPNALAGLPTGFMDLDKRTNGFHAGDLVIIAARPGMGKTSFALNIAEHVAITDKRAVAVFSMEMSADQLTERIMSSYGGIDLARIRSGDLDVADFDRITSAHALMKDAPLYIDETPALTPLDLRARARRLAAQHDIRLIIVDYLQLMQGSGRIENRTNEISEISRNLKALAKELKIPVIALSQLNRGLESRDDKRPRLSDLRESGGIEQDADLVLFIYRDEMYNEASEAKNKAEIILGKHRSGPTGKFEVAFNGARTKFDNLDKFYDLSSLPP